MGRETPLRDLGRGFVRLGGAELPRRSPSPISCVEDALYALLENSAQAGAKNVCVASTLSRRRYRTLAVIDDGEGIPDKLSHTVFEPGVTSRLDENPAVAGLSLYHVKEAADSVGIPSPSTPTAIKATFDITTLPERSLQSRTRPSSSNLHATLQRFLTQYPYISLYYDVPSRILALLLNKRIIRHTTERDRVGIEVSRRTGRRIEKGEIHSSEKVGTKQKQNTKKQKRGEAKTEQLSKEELSEIERVVGEKVEGRYLGVEGIESEVREGEIFIRVKTYEPEEEYEW